MLRHGLLVLKQTLYFSSGWLILINSIYDYAIKRGITTIFHLGDLFDGVKSNHLTDNDIEEINRQLNLFLTQYPHPNKKELKTYSLVGNHDKYINDYLESDNYWNACDLRGLTYFDPSFYMFPYRNVWNDYSTGEIAAKINNFKIHMSHLLYISFMLLNWLLNSIEDIDKNEASMFLDFEYNLLLSGHLHQGFIYTNRLNYDDKERLFLGTPSLSKINLNKNIAYILNFNKDINGNVASIDIEILRTDNNYNISVSDIYNFDFNIKHKSYKRVI